MKNTSKYAICSIIAIAAAGAIGFVILTNNASIDDKIPAAKENTSSEIKTSIESTQDIKKFSSPDELRKFLVSS